MFGFLKRKKAVSTVQSSIIDSGDALLAAAVEKGLVPPDRDMGLVPELMPMFGRASKAFHDIVVEAMARAALRQEPQSGLAVMQRSCMYLFGKGVQAVMLWGGSSDGRIALDFEPGCMLRMELDPCFELDPEDNQKAADEMAHGVSLFAAHQYFMTRAIESGRPVDEEYVRKEMLMTLQWVPRIAISYALMQGYHKG